MPEVLRNRAFRPSDPRHWINLWKRPQKIPKREIVADLVAFDNLPTQVRRAVDYFPFQLQSESIRDCVLNCGATATTQNLALARRIRGLPDREEIFYSGSRHLTKPRRCRGWITIPTYQM